VAEALGESSALVFCDLVPLLVAAGLFGELGLRGGKKLFIVYTNGGGRDIFAFSPRRTCNGSFCVTTPATRYYSYVASAGDGCALGEYCTGWIVC
jgi:hypothetical protein